jgi:hypothetical protein
MRFALRSDWNNRHPECALVVAKNVRVVRAISSELPFRTGFVIAVAKQAEEKLIRAVGRGFIPGITGL